MYRKQIHLSLAVISLIAAALACNFLVSTAKIDNVRLARDEKGEQATTSFGQQDTFYLLGDLKNAPSNTKLKAVWTGVEVQDNPPDTVIDQKELVIGDGTFTFSLVNNNPLWPTGKYKVDLYLNDKLDQTLEFQVEQTEQATAQDTPQVQDTPQPQDTPLTQDTTQAQDTPQASTPAASQDAASYQNIRIARDQQGTDATTVFSPKESFYLVGDLTNAPDAGAEVKVVWTAVKVEGSSSENQVIDTYDKTQPNGGFWVSLVSDSGTWPTGQYKAELYLDGTLVDTRNFIVSATSLANVFMAYDQEGKRPTTVFGTQDVFYLEFDLVNAPADTKISTKWYHLDDQGSPSAPINEADYTFGSGSYYVA
jgi:hypothetical protein